MRSAIGWSVRWCRGGRRPSRSRRRAPGGSGAARLLGFPEDGLRGTAGETALAEVEGQPGDQLNQAVLQKHLRDRLAADPAFRDELRGLVEALPEPTAEQRMAIQDRSVGVQVAGSGNTVNVGGR